MRKRCRSRSCPLRLLTEVPYAGDKAAKVVYIGESPANDEVRMARQGNGAPFCGAAGQLAQKNMKLAGIVWDEVFRMNSARCLIDKVKLSNSQIAEVLSTCRSNVMTAIKAIAPKLIICAGDIAMKQTIRRSGVKKNRGRFLWSKEFGCFVLPTYHPAYIYRNRALEPWLLKDFELAKAFVDNDHKPPKSADVVMYSEVQSIEPFLKRFEDDGEAIAMTGFDTETQGLDWMDPNFLCLSYQLSTTRGKAAMVRLYEETDPEYADFTITWPRLAGKRMKEPVEIAVRRIPPFEKKLDELERLLANARVKKYMVNGNFDLHAVHALFIREGRPSPKVEGYAMDLQAAAQLLEENMFRMASLVDLQFHFTDVKEDYNGEFNQLFDKADMLGVRSKEFVYYGCADADTTCRAAKSIRIQFVASKERKKQARYMAKFVQPTLTKSLLMIERNGAYIDQKALPKTMETVQKQVTEHLTAALAVIPKRIKNRDLHKDKLKLTRGKLVADALFDQEGFKLQPIKKTKGGDAWSTDKEVRKRLLERRLPKKAETFLTKFGLWQEMNTLLTRYLRGFQKHIKIDGHIHSTMSLTTAVTGRVASSNPNMQNNPKRSKSAHMIRRLIAAPDGWLLMGADEGQSELRWAAEVANEPNMKLIFQKGLDIHTETAKELVRRPWVKLTKKEKEKARRDAKPVNFGLLYLMSAYGFVRYAFLEYGLTLTERQAQAYIDAFFRKYSGLRGFHQRTIDFCRKYGYVESILGRRRRLPEINAKNDRDRGEAERQAVNHPIQSPSSDIVLMAGNEIVDQDPNPEEFKLSMFIHDELVALVREDADVEMYGRMVKEAMEHPPLYRDFGYRMSVPLVADVKVGPNLAELELLNL